ncbi:MAG: membrane lipoprotein lipid attachment site-containing protein [Bacteroidales bacterium]|nr:membrane lipoprotein lipid attachment site-containing protein [Bacteroidales bacterium]
MKKVLFIAVAVMLVAGCGQRRAAKSQESEKAACQKDTMEAVEHHCCGHHGEEGCPSEKLEKACNHASQQIEEACEKVEKAADAVEQAAETVESQGLVIEQKGEKPRHDRPRPVPNPYKK